MVRTLLAASFLALSGQALAHPTMADVPDPYGARSITRNDYAVVRRRLETRLAEGDRSPEVLLNLARIYAKANEPAGSLDLYRAVLAAPNADMATLAGSAWSHDIARAGMARVTTAGLAR